MKFVVELQTAKTTFADLLTCNQQQSNLLEEADPLQKTQSQFSEDGLLSYVRKKQAVETRLKDTVEGLEVSN